MMYLTKSQMDKMDALFDAQELPDTFPGDMEYAFMDLLAPEMTLERYLAMSEQERKKWWINCDTQPAAPTGFTDPENGEEIYATHYYFEPASPEILDRIY